MNVLNCATGTLAPYIPSGERPWNRKRVQHLFRRAGFGIAAKDIDPALAQSPSDLVDALMEDAINLPLPEKPYWADERRVSSGVQFFLKIKWADTQRVSVFTLVELLERYLH